jgi:hypothetical protein
VVYKNYILLNEDIIHTHFEVYDCREHEKAVMPMFLKNAGKNYLFLGRRKSLKKVMDFSRLVDTFNHECN